MIPRHSIRRFFSWGALASSLILLLLGVVQRTQAHGYILRSIPGDQAQLDRSPTRIQVWASEGLEPRFSTIRLTNERNENIDLTEVGVSPNNSAQLTARIPLTLPEGAYVIRIRAAFATDGHVLNETRVFWVGSRTSFAEVENVTRGAIPLEIVWRALQLPALSLLFGTLLLYAVVLLPGWGNPTYPAGGLAPRIMTQIERIVWLALIVSLAATVIAVAQHTMTLFSSDLPTVLQEGLWGVVLSSTQVGNMLRARLILIVLGGILMWLAHRMATRAPFFVATLYRATLVVALFMLGTMSAASHAAGSTLWAVQGILTDWLHFAANAAWIGGVASLALILPVGLAPLSRTAQPIAMRAVIRRFSALAALGLALTVVTGVFISALQITAPDQIGSSYYGQSLSFKALLILPLVLIGLYHQLIVNPDRAERWAARLNLPARLLTIIGSLRLESGIALLVLGCAAVLSSTPPPVPVLAAASTPALEQTASVRDLRIRLTLTPGAAGDNGYEAHITRANKGVEAGVEAGVEGLAVTLRVVFPSLDRRSRLLTLDDSGRGTYSSAGLELNRAGEWSALVDVIAADGTSARATFAFDVPAEIPEVATRQASLVNWLAALAVLAVLGGWLRPSIMRWLQRVQWRPAYVVLGAATLLVVVIFSVISWQALDETSKQRDLLANPLPAVVNPTKPDDASLQRGTLLFDSSCASCHTEDSLRRTFAPRRLAELRDEQLFTIIVHGKDDIPSVTLSEAERWDVINYLRSAAFERRTLR